MLPGPVAGRLVPIASVWAILCPGASPKPRSRKGAKVGAAEGTQWVHRGRMARDLTAKPQVARFFCNLQDITITPPASNGK